MIKINIKMRVTPEQSKKVQEICFHKGIYWNRGKNVKYLFAPFLFIDEVISFLYKEEEEDFLGEENEEVDADLFIRTNGTCIEKEEFTYPMWFRSKVTSDIVKFSSLTDGMYVYINEKYNNREIPPINKKTNGFIEHTRKDNWEQVENPNLATDKEIEQVINEEYEKDSSINNGGKTDYYQLENAPFKINDFDDFAEWRGLNGNQFNMGKVMWTFNVGRHNGTDYIRDLNKIIHYANRELLRVSRNS